MNEPKLLRHIHCSLAELSVGSFWGTLRSI